MAARYPRLKDRNITVGSVTHTFSALLSFNSDISNVSLNSIPPLFYFNTLFILSPSSLRFSFKLV